MNKLYGKKAILYRRVSTTDQKVHGNSLNAQKNSLKEFCLKNGIIIKKEFEEDFSAKNFNRPVIKELLEYAKNHKNEIDYLLLTSWDRFSRNTLEALQVIECLKKLNIAVNCIEGWVDDEDPNQIIMRLLYLGLPEADNKLRSQKIKTGIRQANKEGRWVSKQPKGYVPGKDELGRPLMKLDPIMAPLIEELFNDFSLGLYSQNELLKLEKYSSLKLTKSNLSRMLKQIAYAGKIRIRQKDLEVEEIVDGLHEPIISIKVYNKVQSQLQSRRRYNQKSVKLNDKLPLRGLLQCDKCGGNLTGSGSKSKTGDRHFYYHCNPRKGCGERFKVKIAHDELFNYFNDLSPSEEVCNLLELILEKKHEESKHSIKKLLIQKKNKLILLKDKSEMLLEKLLEGTINNDTYKNANIKINSDIIILEGEIAELKESNGDLKEFVKFGLFLFKNLKTFFERASINLKQKLISSIFAEKLVFDGEKYRTPKLNTGFDIIYNSINGLNRIKQKNERLSIDNLPFSTEGGT